MESERNKAIGDNKKRKTQNTQLINIEEGHDTHATTQIKQRTHVTANNPTEDA